MVPIYVLRCLAKADVDVQEHEAMAYTMLGACSARSPITRSDQMRLPFADPPVWFIIRIVTPQRYVPNWKEKKTVMSLSGLVAGGCVCVVCVVHVHQLTVRELLTAVLVVGCGCVTHDASLKF
jgi:hypothetical protein